MANWMRDAASETRPISSMPRMPGPSSSFERPTGISQAKFAEHDHGGEGARDRRDQDVAVVDMAELVADDAAQLALVQDAQDSSVQHTAALRGLRPVANAFGASVGEMYRRGIGWRAWVELPDDAVQGRGLEFAHRACAHRA